MMGSFRLTTAATTNITLFAWMDGNTKEVILLGA